MRLTTSTARTHIGRVIRLTITPAAFSAIIATLPGNVGVENARAPNGDVFVWLDHSTIAKLRRLRAPGESFSDVVLRLAADVSAAQ